MKKPRTTLRLIQLALVMITLVAAGTMCYFWLPNVFLYFYLSCLIWMMLLIAWFCDIMGDWYKYHEHRLLMDISGEEDTL